MGRRGQSHLTLTGVTDAAPVNEKDRAAVRGDVFPENIGTGNPNNRAQEYTAVDDTCGRFLVEELLPEVG